jgi:transposase
MERKWRQREKHRLYLYPLPPYSPVLNRIEILWKHAKHFWRRFVAKNSADLLDEIQWFRQHVHNKFCMTT